MPIYEFYCPDCNAILSFFSKTVNTEKQPACPRCKRTKLERQVSLFAVTGESDETGGDEDLPISDAQMERAMETLAREADSLDENDPRQEARLMRRFSELTGIEYGSDMDEAISRLEAGEDMESVEADMGDVLDGEDLPFTLPGKGPHGSKRPPPTRDETLYDL